MAALQEDLTTGLEESKWFDAAANSQEIDTFMRAWDGPRDLCCLDVFGFSASIAKVWREKGFTSVEYDIGLNPRSDDLLSKRGYLHLTRGLILHILLVNACDRFFNFDKDLFGQLYSQYLPVRSGTPIDRRWDNHFGTTVCDADFHVALACFSKLLPGKTHVFETRWLVHSFCRGG